MRHTPKEYLIAARPWSFPASVMPVLVPGAFLFMKSEFNSPAYVLVLLALIAAIIHTAGNLFSDYHDFNRGVDTAESATTDSMTKGIFTPREIRNYCFTMLAVAAVAGIALLFMIDRGAVVPVTVVGLITGAGTLTYHFMKYRALGEIHIFLFFGVMTTAAASYSIAGYLDTDTMLTGLCYVPSIVAILFANNARDMDYDRQAGIRTLSMKLGRQRSLYFYGFLMSLQYAAVIALVMAGILPSVSLSMLITLPMLVKTIGLMKKSLVKGSGIRNVDEKTAQLQLCCCLLLILSFLAEKFFI